MDFSGQPIPGQTGLHILVAEDNQISQQIIAMMLRAGGHNVTLVSDGESVLENYRSASFDVIVLDMHMPGRTGLEVARAIRLIEFEGQNSPRHGRKGRPGNEQAETEFHCFTNLYDTSWFAAVCSQLMMSAVFANTSLCAASHVPLSAVPSW